MQQALMIVLLLLIVAAAASLILDARQRRLDRRVAAALSGAQAESIPSIRRPQGESRWGFFHRLANYRPGIAYLVSPSVVLLAGAVAAATIVYANGFVGFSPAYALVAALVAAIVTVRGLFGWQRRRFTNKLFRQLPDTIAMVISAIRTGLPVNEAFRAISREMSQPTAGQFAMVCSEMALGKPPEEAIEGIYQRTGVAEYGFFAVTLGVQMKAGGRLGETLQTLGDTVRERVALAARAKALAAEVIFSARALSVSPVIVGGLLYLMSPSSVDLLFTDPVGVRLLTYAVASVIVGTLVIRWMVRRGTAL
jgi:tight adherence protein B